MGGNLATGHRAPGLASGDDRRAAGSHFFVTVDAETEAIRDGIRIISQLRDEVEAEERVRMPLVWFVRFQRSWTESVDNDRAHAFQGPPVGGYDGFALARRQLLELRDRGDEIAWHYHAYNYVHRDDLSHATRIEILRADLASCAQELRRRHPEFSVASFRFGWFFVPDYAIYEQLERLGITRDASIDPGREELRVLEFSARYLRPLVRAPTRVGGLTLFPISRTLVLHDWTLVAHDFGWSRLEAGEAAVRRDEFHRDLAATAADLRRRGGAFLTYETAPAAMIQGLARA